MVDEFYTTEPHQFVTPGYGVASSQAWEVEPGNQARYGGFLHVHVLVLPWFSGRAQNVGSNPKVAMYF